MPQVAMTTLRPKRGRGKGVLLLLGFMNLAFIVAVGRSLMEGQPMSGSAVLDLLGVVSVLLLVNICLVLEDKRMRSIEIGSDGIRALTWGKAFGFIPCRLLPVHLLWQDVTEVAQNGLVVNLRGKGQVISVNTYLFDDPKNVHSFISQNLSTPA